ncbi:uncharacterized protein LOC108666386 isoform X2 [Hyalella azteca]|uniref:Uncharacterized protein LOC108666386 isoform X2 n=1 Tax=Hyalella azteca TaxID=294128 RepID=A0A979FPQ5_HYAAZ|nr:uncharacterized protein LOC108666386 isoform X2 [Hyalella azteca]
MKWPRNQKHKLCSAPKIIYRLTITLWTEQDNIRELVAAAQSMYDIVALTPMTDAALIQCCQLGVSPDIISIDGYTEIGNDALKRLSTVPMNDTFVELLYYPCVGSSSSTARQSSIRLNQSVVRAVRGRHVFVSCGSSETACLRSPRDVLGFCSLMGLSEEQAHAALSRVCADLLFCAARRRRQTLTKQRSSYTTKAVISSDVVLPVAVIKRNIVEHAKRSIMSTNIKRPVKRQKNTNKA